MEIEPRDATLAFSWINNAIRKLIDLGSKNRRSIDSIAWPQDKFERSAKHLTLSFSFLQQLANEHGAGPHAHFVPNCVSTVQREANHAVNQCSERISLFFRGLAEDPRAWKASEISHLVGEYVEGLKESIARAYFRLWTVVVLDIPSQISLATTDVPTWSKQTKTCSKWAADLFSYGGGQIDSISQSTSEHSIRANTGEDKS